MKEIDEHKPKEMAISVDGWSAFRHGYIGVNAHYLYKWKRVKINMACKNFIKSHTSANMWEFLKELFAQWGIYPR